MGPFWWAWCQDMSGLEAWGFAQLGGGCSKPGAGATSSLFFFSCCGLKRRQLGGGWCWPAVSAACGLAWGWGQAWWIPGGQAGGGEREEWEGQVSSWSCDGSAEDGAISPFLAAKVHTYFRTIFWPIFWAFHLKYYLQRSCLFTSNPGIVQHKLAVCCGSLQGWCVPLHCSFVPQQW